MADDTRWLDDDEHETWMALATLVVRLPAALDRQLQRDSGLSHFEYQVLAGLSHAPERTLRMSVLASFAEGQLPRLSQVAARLEKRGWLTRAPDPTDGRYTLATLTDEGMAALVDSAPGHVDTVRRVVFDSLTKPQVRQLRDIARRINQATGDSTPC
ncbi:MarR family winged helix-turn-helix transcriptional regulator [Actinokineospora cianjurensis]|uniref:DNA-binding MarR family transcriptional regulator n=1 Tax=Actinokineospora cianjurensis TaxID=585224 RepID=A0A421AYV6_9PSEU|nr:MarR family transcriptional regulator [Actinokineospora cianjurensis]RLK55052.1 DNA-binding MarR family transcriptional regulator [Actinokineospora cianjurensis]